MKILDLFPELRDALASGPLTTQELEELLLERYRYRCPDDLAKSLNMLRRTGELQGRVSVERGGWIWWVGTPEDW